MALLSGAQGEPRCTLSTACFHLQTAPAMAAARTPYLKKLEACNARWAPSKELLGFVFDGQSLMVHRTQRKALGIT
jgi:hypothetical protein